MSSRAQTEGRMETAIKIPDMWDACEVFKQWAATDEGKRSWLTSCAQLSLQGICNALVHTQATRFGLLLTHRGAIIWSRFSPGAYRRLAPLYEAASHSGLCFWFDGDTFLKVGGEIFLDLVQMLPQQGAQERLRSS